MDFDWAPHLAEQLSWHWEAQLRPRLEGLTDDEYFWEPVPDCWSLRRDPAVAGAWTIDWRFPPPDPVPVTTIAWRLTHLIVGVFGMRVASHFCGPAISYDTHRYAATAAGALQQLDSAYGAWISGVRGLTAERLTAPTGPAEPFPDAPFADLVLHIHREAIHHGAEVALLRDLYLRH
jgi:DinB family protein